MASSDLDTDLPFQPQHAIWAVPVHQAVNIAVGPLMTKTRLAKSEQEAHETFIAMLEVISASLEIDTALARALESLGDWVEPQLSESRGRAACDTKRARSTTHADACRAVVYARANWSIRNSRVSAEQQLVSLHELLREPTAALATVRAAIEATDSDFLPHLAIEAEQRARESPAMARAMHIAAERLATMADGGVAEKYDDLPFQVALAILLWEGVTSRGGSRWKG